MRLRTLTGYTAHPMVVHAILPAAGLGTRMAVSGVSAKQFLSLGGVPILIHSVRAFADKLNVSTVTLAVRATEIDHVRAQLKQYGFGDKVRVVTGGETRQESVAAALRSLDAGDDDIVLVHDAVRPLIEPATIERTIEAIAKHGAAIVGVGAIDTIKLVERTADGAIITGTVPRERVVQAQTPQGARYADMLRAFDEAEVDSFAGTDEASLLERAGITVAVVQGSSTNLKITQPGDLELAEFYLKARR
ncbi:2-C-methyl-D-erythritol 4-phosphate cytidylyltransferase [Terriglobus roseus]|uniref:2-C-methyl-D-erythritol 4-phosphate cytidylyltransferase n=2 Tax=Terriglobus roseus TaxID=392734 RepID=A0A1G7F028_9BACT|nr:2-C-methyl-D-erythritol 4-phosphate cytidylyltransferase [Terriglobus roseus]